MAILEVRDLKTYFYTRRGVVKVVDGVTFSVEAGEILGLVGESGCGKTMTSLSILRLVPQPRGKIAGGEIFFNGEDLLKKSEREMRNIRGRLISMILQEPMTSLNPVFTIGEQIAEPIRIHQKLRGSAIWEKVKEMLELVGIFPPEMRMHSFPHQLSGGMRQRVAGGIALSCQPKLLIADEPTTALDMTLQAQYLQLIEELHRKLGMSVIFITHDFGIVARICTRVAVMYAGKIVEIAPVEEIFYHTAHPYTMALMKSVPNISEEVERLYSIDGQPPSLLSPPPGCSFSPRCPMAHGRCSETYPPETRLSEGHSVWCWRAADG
jgi:oligopeptide/dipeptide ABC transporter ATP-binding protein